MTKIKKNQSSGKCLAPNLEEAINKIQEFSLLKKRKFVESVDIAINLGIDSKQSDQAVKGSVLLPYGTGKKMKVIVFTPNEEQKKLAIEAGATMAGFEDLMAKIEEGFLDFDRCIATPDIMQKLSKLAKKLGPRGLMPSPKNGTVTTEVTKAVIDALRGKIDFKNDKGGTIHCLIGKVNFDSNFLIENTKTILKAIKEAKPENSKGKFIKELYFSTTMGPSVQVAVDSL